MTVRKNFGLALLAATSPLALTASPVWAQEPTPLAPPPTTQNVGNSNIEDASDEIDAGVEEVVVTGQRLRGAVIGDVKPIQQYDAGDIRALGVSSISELLTELGPQVQSASGRPPVMLLEGHRMSSPREIASLPSEAIERVDVLPEEVGLKYGYGADQRVVNIVLRERFRSVNVELDGRIPTTGVGLNGQAEFGYLGINNGKRFNIGAELQGQDQVLETQRGLAGPDSEFRTLVPSSQQLTVNSTYYRSLADRLSGTINGEVTTTQNKSLIGRALLPVVIPATSPYAVGGVASVFSPEADGVGALERTSSSQTGHLGFTLARDHSKGQVTLTGNYDHSYSRSLSDRPFDLSAYAAAVASGDPAANPVDDVSPQFLAGPFADETLSFTDTGDLDLLYNTALAELPSGEIAMTAHLSGSTLSFRSERTRDGLVTPSRVRRDIGGGSINLNIPIAGMATPLAEAIGNLSANVDASIDYYSDAGSVHSYGGGINWQPARTLRVSANYNNRQTAPTPQQLGDAPVVTANVPIFDYVRGETVNVSTISGGNLGLDKAENQNFRLGINWAPLRDPDLNMSFDISHSRTTGGISSLPGISLATQTAFAERFVRDPLDPDDPDDDGQTVGRLRQVDLRPINIFEQKSTQIRWGFNFTKQLKTPQREIQAFQEVARRRIQERLDSGQIPPEQAARIRAFMNGQGGAPGQAAQGQGAAAAPGAAAPSGQAAQGPGQAQGNQAQAGQAGAAGQQGQQAQQGGENTPTIVVQGTPNGGPPQGFVFRGPGGPGGPGGPPGGFRGPPGGFGGFGGGGFGGGGGGNQPRGGRLNFSLYHTWMLDNTTQLDETLPVIDLLNGGTLGGGAGPSAHQLQIQAGYTQGGFGFRLFANWNSATRSIGSAGTPETNLRFGANTNVNFRVFINFSQMPKIVDKIPFLRGSRLIFGANNLFDTHVTVTDGNGNTPYSYQGPFLDRQGRSVSIGFRKLFF